VKALVNLLADIGPHLEWLISLFGVLQGYVGGALNALFIVLVLAVGLLYVMRRESTRSNDEESDDNDYADVEPDEETENFQSDDIAQEESTPLCREDGVEHQVDETAEAAFVDLSGIPEGSGVPTSSKFKKVVGIGWIIVKWTMVGLFVFLALWSSLTLLFEENPEVAIEELVVTLVLSILILIIGYFFRFVPDRLLLKKISRVITFLIFCFVLHNVVTADWDDSAQADGADNLNQEATCPDDVKIVWSNCIGALTYPDGAEYFGEINEDQANGTGQITWADGGRYNGNFANGERSGNGTMVWGNGDTYSGGWRNGLRSGQGVWTEVSGVKFEGSWRNGKLHGFATEYGSDGTVLRQGQWRENEFLGAE